MKKRLGFVANSSSGDYILDEDDQNEEDTDDYYGWEVPVAKANAKSVWDNDLIQFARLITELAMTQDLDLDALEVSMNLEYQDIDELFDRAQRIWQKAVTNRGETK